MSTLMFLIIILVIILLYFRVDTFYKYRKEKNSWNQGYCPECGEEWEPKCTNDLGDRTYSCKNGHTITITFEGIDI